MTIEAYLAAMKERFVGDPIVTHFHVIRERSTLVDGHIPNICNAPPRVRSR
jgi:hypothetical protein